MFFCIDQRLHRGKRAKVFKLKETEGLGKEEEEKVGFKIHVHVCKPSVGYYPCVKDSIYFIYPAVL